MNPKWQDTATKETYQKALQATTSLTSNNTGLGFIEPHTFTGGQLSTNLAKQNNTLIQLLVQALEKVLDLEQAVANLTAQVTRLEKTVAEKDTVKLPESVLNDLTKEFGKVNIGKGKGIEGTNTSKDKNFYVWKNPFTQYNEQKPNKAPGSARN
uniref:Uncharacterized protein n=1 Tax=Rubus yellow net virus TaxID=198310 RepID=A0A7S6NGH0_9VIRU|nr:hypothetical protein [Rubus yellow net virus]